LKITSRFFIAFLIYVLCISCGLETYVYLNPVEIVSVTEVTRAEIVLPSQSAAEFRNYTIFYRIYLSSFLVSASVESQLSDINTTLASHYRTLAPYTIDDNVSPASIDSVFRNLRYYYISLNDNLNNEKQLYKVLNSPSWGTIKLDFSSRDRPPFLTDTNGSDEYDLLRANSFTSQPDRLFIYTTELESSISDTVNIDVQMNPNGQSYAYVSMYILATGINENYSPLYSRPKHIGIFRLPN